MGDRKMTNADSDELRKAMDKVMARVTLDDIAEAAGYSVNTLKQARLDPSASGYRKLPAGLRRILHQICRERANYFLQLARQLKPVRE